MVFHRDTPFLRPAIASVLGQSFRDLELVLVDNGCGTALAALGDAGRDPRVRLIRLPENLGIPLGLGAGLAEVKGEFVTLLDYDDIALPNRVARQVEALRADARLGLVSSMVDLIDEHGTVMRRDFSLLRSDEQQAYMRFAAPVVTPAFSGRRAAFWQFPHRVGFKWCSDYDQLARISEAWRVVGLPEVLTQYRQHASQTTVRRRDEMLLEICGARLLTSRRLASRTEDFAGVMAVLDGWRGLPPGDFFLKFAHWFLNEGFADQAVYHARKALAYCRNSRTFAEVGGVVAGALRQEPGRAGFLLHLLGRGPVHALHLHPNRAS
jgi:hypothetical protein